MDHFKIEVHLKIGDPLLRYEVDRYFISADGMLLHLKSDYGNLHIIIPFSNILHFTAVRFD